MNYTFSQSTGKITDATGNIAGLAYAGNGTGLLNPDKQNVVNTGPLPRGKYTLELVDDPHKGPRVFSLTPDPSNEMFGRSRFMVHWDNANGNFTASEGCIVPLNTPLFYRLQTGDTIEVAS